MSKAKKSTSKRSTGSRKLTNEQYERANVYLLENTKYLEEVERLLGALRALDESLRINLDDAFCNNSRSIAFRWTAHSLEQIATKLAFRFPLQYKEKGEAGYGQGN